MSQTIDAVKIALIVVLAFMFGWKFAEAKFYGQLFQQQVNNVSVMEKRK